jgi:dihydroflavonol-4-reductase
LNLVTGATGIIGSHVALQLLLQGQEVTAVRQRNSDLARVQRLFAFYTPTHEELFQKIKWIELDILDVFAIEDALEQINVVFHCAGFVSFRRADRKKLFLINEQGTRNMVNASLQKKVAAFCHVSTIGTVNNAEYPFALHEGVFWKTSGKESDYAISKYNAEREVWRGMEEGLNIVIVNPGVVLSPVFWQQSSSQIFERCYNGNKFYTDGQSAYVAATDVSIIMVELVKRRIFGQRFIVIENNYTFKKIFDLVHGCLKKPAARYRVSDTTLKIMGFVHRFFYGLIGKDPLLTKSLINAALNRQSYINEKVKNTLGFTFEPVDKTIRKICEFYLKERQKTLPSV